MAGLHFDITGDNKNLLRNLEGSKQGIRSTVQEAEKAGVDMDAIFRKIGSAAATIGIGFSATQLISDVVRVRGEIQSLQKSFDVLAGAKGGELFEQIKEFAVKTPMDMPELAKGAQTLMAFNTEAEEVMPILKTMGDIAMGNKDKFQSLILAFSQMRSTGRLMGQDLMQMINAGFNPLSVMSEQTGKSVGQLKEEMSNGAISAEMVTKAFMDATAEGGKFHGMLETMSGGVDGMRSNLEGAITDMLNAIGEKTQGAITGTMSVATQLVENYEEVGRAIGLVATAYGSYKAVLMAVNAYTSVQHALEKKHLAETLASKSAELDADLASAVAKGKVTQARAMEVQVLRNELKEKLQVAVVNDRIAQSELQTATIKYENNLKDIGLSKLRVKQAQQELLAAQATGNAERINNAQMELSNAQKQKHLAIQESSILKRNMEAAAATAEATAEARVVAAKNAETLSTGQLIKKELALAAARAKAALTNPYVLAAAAAAALAVGIYAVVTAKSAEEKAIDKVNKAREESNKKREEEKSKIDELRGVINNDTQTRTAQIRAYEELTSILPEYTKGLSLEALQAISSAEQEKLLNEILEKRKYDQLQKDLALYKNMLVEVEEAEGNWSNMSQETQNAIREKFGTGLLKNKAVDIKAFIKSIEEEMKNAKPIDVKIEDAQKAADKAKIVYEAMKNKLDSMPPWEVSWEFEQNVELARQAYVKTQEELNNLQASQGKGTTTESAKGKKYWEDKKKAAEGKRDELDVSEIGGAKWNQYEAEIKEANRMLERYSGKYLEDAKKRDEELLELKRQTAEELADINKSELDRELADVQDNYAKRMEELAKLEEEWKTAQGGRLTDEQSSALSSGRDAANDVRNRGVSDAVNAQMERYKQEKDEEKKHLEDLLEEFETYEQARERIAKEYAEKRKQMVNEDGSLKAGFTQGNLDNVNAQQREAEDALDQAMLEKSESYQAWLESIETKTLDSLREALVQAKFALEMATMRGDSKGTAMAKAQVDALSKQIKEMETSPKKRSLEDWRNLSEAISEAGDSFEGLSEELESMGGDVGKVAGAILKSVGSIGSSTIGLINNITQLTQMSIKGTQETDETSSKAVQSVEKASVILAIISAAVQIITKIINLANQMHDAKYDKVIEENQAKIDSMKKSYEGLQEQLEETFGTGAVQTLQEMNASLEQQNKLIEEQKRAEEEKKKTDESAMQGYDDALEANRKQMEENTKAMEEAIFGDDIKSAIESFAEAYGDAIAEGKDLNQSMKDHAVEMMKQMVQEEIKAYIAGQGKLEALREKMALYFEDGVFSDSEIAAIKAEAEAIGRDLDEKFAWAEDLLAEEDSSSSSSSSKRGIATASQESVDENNGRLMSIQLSMGEIKEQMIYTVTYLASMTSSISSGNHILSDIREQAVRANGLLEDIVKYTKPLNDKVGEVVSAVNRINSK